MTLRNAWVIAALAIGWSPGSALGAPFLIAADTARCTAPLDRE